MYWLTLLYAVLTGLNLLRYLALCSRYQTNPTNENKFQSDHAFRWLIAMALALLVTLLNWSLLLLPVILFMGVLFYVEFTRKPLDD